MPWWCDGARNDIKRGGAAANRRAGAGTSSRARRYTYRSRKSLLDLRLHRHNRAVDTGMAIPCIEITAELKVKKSNGDFDAMVAWLQKNRGRRASGA